MGKPSGDKPTVQRRKLAPGVIHYKPAVLGLTTKEALEFYAEQKNYKPKRGPKFDKAPVFVDHGRLAQMALGEELQNGETKAKTRISDRTQ